MTRCDTPGAGAGRECAVVQRMGRGLSPVVWLEELEPLTWTDDARRAFVFSSNSVADAAARELAARCGEPVVPVSRVAPRVRRSFFSRRERMDWRIGKRNCGVE